MEALVANKDVSFKEGVLVAKLSMVSIFYFFSDSGPKCRKRKLKLRLLYSCISIIGLVRRRKLIVAHYFQKAQTLHETQTHVIIGRYV